MMFRCPSLSKIDSVSHGFFGRKGGVSEGLYNSLNCGLGSQDEKDNIIRNRDTLLEMLGVEGAKLCSLYQIHSNKVIPITEPLEEEADAMVTATRGLAIGVLTADCGPVLFADEEAGVIGAAHSGWKGAMTGVLENTVEEMVGLGAKEENIIATLGPCISKDSYEVGEEFRDKFLEQDGSNDVFFVAGKREGHFMFDLPGYILARLGKLNLRSVNHLDHDTVTDEENFFSYRRSTLNGEEDYGRQISVICLE